MKNGGGHFAPELGGHFELESGGHFKLELGGQYHWNLQIQYQLKKDKKIFAYWKYYLLRNWEDLLLIVEIKKEYPKVE